MTDAPRAGCPRRRSVLGGLVAAPLALTMPAGCVFGDDPAGPASHPALRPPLGEGALALVAVPPDPRRAREVVAALARRVRDANAAGATPSTIAVGGTWFAKAGLADRRPAAVARMPAFPGDRFARERTGGDVVVLVEGGNRPTADAAMTAMVAGLEGLGAVVRWRAPARREANTVHDGRAYTRNPLGFVEGAGNPDARDGEAVDGVTLIRAGDGVPAWAVGGTYLSLRVIRLDRAAWDAETPARQEQLIGRRTDGRWLDSTVEDGGEPDYADDYDGARTPLDAHVRLANPRRPGDAPPPLVRRSWGYAVEAPGGRREEGVLFMGYQNDLTAGFEAVQRRLAAQALNSYLTTVGGGYFVVPPRDPGRDRGWEQALLA